MNNCICLFISLARSIRSLNGGGNDMDDCKQQHSASQAAQQAVRIVFIVLLVWAMVSDNARAESRDSEWLVTVPIYLTAGAYLASADTGTDFASSASASAELLLSSPSRLYDMALFVDYRFSRNPKLDKVVHVGSFVQFYSGRWDTTAYVFQQRARHKNNHWGYAGRSRFAFTDQHKLGLEAFATLREPSNIDLSLGYYGKISDALSIKVVAGSNIKSGRQRSARTELVWQFN